MERETCAIQDGMRIPIMDSLKKPDSLRWSDPAFLLFPFPIAYNKTNNNADGKGD